MGNAGGPQGKATGTGPIRPGILKAPSTGAIMTSRPALDRPLRGSLGVTADSYQLIYDQLMK